MSEYIPGWDMQDAIGRVADLEAELLKERRAYQELESQLAKLRAAIEPWVRDEPGVMQELAGEKTLMIPLSEYRKIQTLTESEAGDE